jgi:glutathione S-transferase
MAAPEVALKKKKLYGHPISPRYRRVAIAAAELGVPLDLVVLDVARGDARSAEYLARNPMGKMPTLEDDDGWSLWESFAIIVYLAETHPSGGLFPTTPRGRAEALRWMFWASAHLDPAVASLFAQRFLAPRRKQAPDEAIVATSLAELARYVPVLEGHLARQPWMLGEAFSLVDVALGASVDALLRKELAFDTENFPALRRFHERFAARPSLGAGAAV